MFPLEQHTIFLTLAGWNRTGSVTSCVRTTVPAGMATFAVGVLASVNSTSAVAARAPWSR